MRLGEDKTIWLSGQPVVLRPSLRGALRLSDRYTQRELLTGVIEGNTTVLTDLLLATSHGAGQFDRSVFDYYIVSFALDIDRIVNDLWPLALAVCGIIEEDEADEPNEDEQPDESKTDPFRENTEFLYGVATGVLGWLPAQAYEATPIEIRKAFEAKIDHLVMLNGGKGKGSSKAQTSLDDQVLHVLFANKTRVDSDAQ